MFVIMEKIMKRPVYYTPNLAISEFGIGAETHTFTHTHTHTHTQNNFKQSREKCLEKVTDNYHFYPNLYFVYYSYIKMGAVT